MENEMMFTIRCFQALSAILFLWVCYFAGLYRAHKSISSGKDDVIKDLHDLIDVYKITLQRTCTAQKEDSLCNCEDDSIPIKLICTKCGKKWSSDAEPTQIAQTI